MEKILVEMSGISLEPEVVMLNEPDNVDPVDKDEGPTEGYDPEHPSIDYRSDAGDYHSSWVQDVEEEEAQRYAHGHNIVHMSGEEGVLVCYNTESL